MSPQEVIEVLRLQAWERAKAELRSVLHCYFGEEEAYKAADSRIEIFIKDFEDNCV